MAKKNRVGNKQKKPQKTGFHRKKNLNKQKFIVNDEFTIKARKAGFRARSIYKLFEIQERFDLIKPNFNVIDIGCAPGSFLQAIANVVKEKIIIGVDLKQVKKLPYKNVETIICDIFDFEKLDKKILNIIGENKFDLITSDIAPNTTGRFDVDQYASVELNIEICKFSDKFLKKGGNMLLKVFKGEDFGDLVLEIKKRFKKLKTYKPLACRHSSKEEYIICLEKI